MQVIPAALLAVLLVLGGLAAQAPDADRTATCAAWLKEHSKPPLDYLLSKFEQHDCVLLGETHEVRQNCAFVASALVRLHEAGVRDLATEFLRARDTEAMNHIVTAKDYDEIAVIAMMRDGPWPTWGFQDYADIFRAVWKVNADREDGASPMRVIGLDSDWTQHELWFGGVTPREHMKILLEREQTMIDAVADGPLAHDRKVLVHCGNAHAVTCQGERLGTVLRRRFGERVFQVSLHHALRTRQGVSWITDWLEELFASVAEGPIGFDLGASPFADLRDERLPRFRMLRDQGIGGLSMGYVVLVPAAEFRRPRWIPGFITEQTFEKARAIAVKLGYAKEEECPDVAALEAVMAERFPH